MSGDAFAFLLKRPRSRRPLAVAHARECVTDLRYRCGARAHRGLQRPHTRLTEQQQLLQSPPEQPTQPLNALGSLTCLFSSAGGHDQADRQTRKERMRLVHFHLPALTCDKPVCSLARSRAAQPPPGSRSCVRACVTRHQLTCAGACERTRAANRVEEGHRKARSLHKVHERLRRHRHRRLALRLEGVRLLRRGRLALDDSAH